jgi:bacillithiol biosynthesis cysteine-adding enzyme BshC
MKVEVRAGEGALALDPVTAPLLPALPTTDATWRAAAKAARRTTPPPALAQALAAFQREVGAGAAAERNAASLADGALLVVAGQQPGLLGGPLLALHKAAGALSIAERARGAGVEKVVPVFWVASEDHDWAEANRALVIGRDGEPRSLSLPVQGDLRSVRDVPVPTEASDALLRDLAAALPDTERARAAVALASRPDGQDLGRWFATTLVRLLGPDTGLVVVEPHVLAPFATDVLARLVEQAETVARALARGAERLSSFGLVPPVEVEPGRAPLFLREAPGGSRLRVSLEGSRVFLRGEPSSLDRAGLVARLRGDPRLASADVVGRVLVQNGVLPVLAQVAGPTEIVYLAQAREAHDALAVPFPVVVPRPRATWVETRVARDLEAFGLSVADVLAGASPPEPSPADSALAAEVDEVRARLAAREAEAQDPETARVLRVLAEQAARAAGRLSEVEARRRGVGRARYERARAALFPRERAQERVLSPFSVVARHGVETLRRGLAALDPLAPGHHLLHLDADGER